MPSRNKLFISISISILTIILIAGIGFSATSGGSDDTFSAPAPPEIPEDPVILYDSSGNYVNQYNSIQVALSNIKGSNWTIEVQWGHHQPIDVSLGEEQTKIFSDMAYNPSSFPSIHSAAGDPAVEFNDKHSAILGFNINDNNPEAPDINGGTTGVNIDNSNENFIFQNEITSNYGVSGEGTTGNYMIGNVVKNGNTGFYFDTGVSIPPQPGPPNQGIQSTDSTDSSLMQDSSTSYSNYILLNSITGHSEFGLVNNSSTNVDATLNWWGSAAGPTVDWNNDGNKDDYDYLNRGQKISGSSPVAYSPWLGVNPDSDPISDGMQPSTPLTIIVDDIGPAPGPLQENYLLDYYQDYLPFLRNSSTDLLVDGGYLNRAIFASNIASGNDTINVRSGEFHTNEPITDSVVMQGTQEGAEISGDVLVYNGEATFSNLTFNNGIFFDEPGSNGTVTNNSFPGSDAEDAYGIYWNDQYNWNPPVPPTIQSVEENENSLNGASSVNKKLSSSEGRLNILFNDLKNRETGIFLESPPKSIIGGNVIEGNNKGIGISEYVLYQNGGSNSVNSTANQASDVSHYIIFNSIAGNKVGLDLAVSGKTDASLNWWGSSAGPDVSWKDSDVEKGDLIDASEGSVIYSPWLAENPDSDDEEPGVQMKSRLTYIADNVGVRPEEKYFSSFATGSTARTTSKSNNKPKAIPGFFLPEGYLGRAIGAANASGNKDTILVKDSEDSSYSLKYDGNNYDPIIKQPLSIEGDNYPSVRGGFEIEFADEVEIFGVEVSGLESTDSGYKNGEDGIHLYGSGLASIKGNIVKNSGRNGITLETEFVPAGTPVPYKAGREATPSAAPGTYYYSNSNSLQENEVYGNTESGIELVNSDYNHILKNEIYDNSTGILLSKTSYGNRINYNSIHDNDFGVDSGAIVDATLNWWGDSSGPSGQGEGDGDAVSENVVFSPWLEKDPDSDRSKSGVQLPNGVSIRVDDIGPKPEGGYLKTALEAATSELLPGQDTIYIESDEEDNNYQKIKNQAMGTKFVILTGGSSLDFNRNLIMGEVTHKGTETADFSFNYWGSPPEVSGSTGKLLLTPWLLKEPGTDKMTYKIENVGAKPGSGLKRALKDANSDRYKDKVKVAEGTYKISSTTEVSEPTDIVSCTGCPTDASISGELMVNTSDVRLGSPADLMKPGLNVKADVIISRGVDASDVHINWNNIYGKVANNGNNTLDATYNWWGDENPDDSTVGSVDFSPYLPDTVCSVLDYMEENDLENPKSAVAAMACEEGSASEQAVCELTNLGLDTKQSEEIIGQYGLGRVVNAMEGAASSTEFTELLGGYSRPAGAGGGLTNNTVAGKAGSVGGRAVGAVFTKCETIKASFALSDFQGNPTKHLTPTVSLVRIDKDGNKKGLTKVGAATYSEKADSYVAEFSSCELEPGYYLVQIDLRDLSSLEQVIKVEGKEA